MVQILVSDRQMLTKHVLVRPNKHIQQKMYLLLSERLWDCGSGRGMFWKFSSLALRVNEAETVWNQWEWSIHPPRSVILSSVGLGAVTVQCSLAEGLWIDSEEFNASQYCFGFVFILGSWCFLFKLEFQLTRPFLRVSSISGGLY